MSTTTLSPLVRSLKVLRVILAKVLGLPLAVLRSPTTVKLSTLVGLLAAYMFYKSRKTKISRILKKTAKNLRILDQLSSMLATYRPTFWLPTAESQIIRGAKKNLPTLIKYELMVVQTTDGETLHIDVYPRDFSEMPPATPIIAFRLGACGSTKENYCRELTTYVVEKGWRIAVLNRRGFSEHGTTCRLLHHEDYDDIHHGLLRLHEFFPAAPIYLMGVSAGANNSACYLGNYGENTPVRGYVSISNPFNLCRISYTMKYNFWGNIFSRAMVKDFKKILERNMKNPLFQELIRMNYQGCDRWSLEIDKRMTTWEIDKFFTAKASGFESVYDYYYHASSEHVVENIKVPTLVISNAEDPVCLKENIPIEKLYRNENIITLLASRGGHIEYLSGSNEEWFAFKVALRYFEALENDPSLQRQLPKEISPRAAPRQGSEPSEVPVDKHRTEATN